MGTPEFAAIILKRLINSPFKPYLVITEPDKPSGRGKTLTPPAVKILAKQENIETWQPKYISQIANRLSELMPDLFIVAAYGQIIPKDILNAAQFGGINVHPSLLPKYRGSTPIQSAILNGDKITGITIMKMDEKMDHGPILTQREVEVPNDFSFPDLNTGLAKKGASQLIGTIPLYLSKSVRGRSQNNENATYTKKIIKRDGLINWREKSKIIDRKIRAYYPWPGAHTIINGKKIKICQSHLENDKLIIDRVQLEGKKEMTFDEFKRGWRGNLDFLDKIS
ncbi:methionyl-tRNA formyltransferase [Candidatus Berkelbacteria bacterium RIFCSPHIGHO2_12_FULL_36_9]|uniref:Methionyl-tRNA formyltransferase n=1 Tax=Candidatus Berkelbacteria bacterium RIFCSPHIGHO2_12_FULL_36_9 TaxID=1797469 RepID=A0A1F5EKE2_9BACT|nr:MAG: methionyl-tRNA formyltransferase [Candidatus Berkelbacteria bacterium RIFCSPHIGHO2_12_FULL_36_9]